MCDQGYFQNQTGQTSCLKCSAGSSSGVSAVGAEFCLGCSVGSFKNLSSGVCTRCSPGYYQDIEGETGCPACPTGRFTAQAGSTVCQLAPPGTYIDKSASQAATSCPVGSSSVEAGSSTCTPCPPPSFTRNNGSVYCDTCNPRQYPLFLANSDFSYCQDCSSRMTCEPGEWPLSQRGFYLQKEGGFYLQYPCAGSACEENNTCQEGRGGNYSSNPLCARVRIVFFSFWFCFV